MAAKARVRAWPVRPPAHLSTWPCLSCERCRGPKTQNFLKALRAHVQARCHTPKLHYAQVCSSTKRPTYGSSLMESKLAHHNSGHIFEHAFSLAQAQVCRECNLPLHTYGSLGRFDPSVSTAEDRVASDAARREIHMRLMQRLELADLNKSPSWHQGFSLIDAERIFKVMCPLPSPPLVWEVRCVHCLGFPSVQVLCPLRPLLVCAPPCV